MIHPLRKIAPALGLMAFALACGPACAQEGVLMKQMLGNLGILPEERDPIEYKERPGLVVPRELGRLPPPEPAKADPRWPRDPDVAEREANRRRREGSTYVNPGADPLNGARLSPAELARHRTERDSSNLGGYNFSDRGGVRLSAQEMATAGKLGAEPTYPPGTEPPRKYLTDPPKGARIPSGAAPIGKARVEGQVIDNGRPDGAWKRLD